MYIYVEVARLSVELCAIFANDERAIKLLERTPFWKVFQNVEITKKWKKWKKYQGVDFSIVRLKQVAKPQSLSTNQRDAPASRSQQSVCTDYNASHSNANAV
jgi:hypothetical protein